MVTIMTLTYRNYETHEDLTLQRNFWIEATKNLAFPWKPSFIQDYYKKKTDFDPRSKFFAFEGDQLIGYQSFIAGSNFIGLGYPWVHDHPKKHEIQEKLWNDTMDILNKDFPNRFIKQRFREQWKDQIQFFLDRGFSIDKEYPMYVHNVRKDYSFELPNKKIMKTSFEGLREDLLRNVLQTKKSYDSERINRAIRSARDIDYDISIYLESEGKPIAYAGLTTRFDASYSEIEVLRCTDQNFQFEFCNQLILQEILKELSQRKIRQVSLTIFDDDNQKHNQYDKLIPIISELGFNLESKSVFVGLNR